MRKFILLFTLLLLCSYVSFAQPAGASGEWTLAFEDQFAGSSLDATKWNTGYTWGKTHNHRAYCVPENVSVENGLLRIKATNTRHPDAPATCTSGGVTYSLDYTSGVVNSNSKFNLQYGFIEGRFKAPSTLGTWPAFWLLNANGAWPPEIDILEIPAARTDHHYYFHYGADWTSEASFGGVHSGVDKSLAFHTYGVEWGPNYMRYYFDGTLVKTYYRSEPSQGLNMYLIINLAVGGWAGNPPTGAVFPCYFECDWIKVWKPIFGANTKYKIVNKLSGKLVEVVDASTADGGNIKQYYDNGNTCQQWQIIDGGGTGYYWLRNINSDKAMEVVSSSTAAGANIAQMTYNGGANQCWQIVSVGNGYYKFVNKNSGKVMEVVGSNADNGANIAQNTWTGADNQLFQLVAAGNYKSLDLNTEVLQTNEATRQVYSFASTIFVKSTENATVEIFNICGQLVQTKQIAAGTSIIPATSKGIVLVRVSTKTSTKVEKVYIE